MSLPPAPWSGVSGFLQHGASATPTLPTDLCRAVAPHAEPRRAALKSHPKEDGAEVGAAAHREWGAAGVVQED